MFKAATADIDSTPYVNRILGIDDGEGDKGDDGAAEAAAE